MKVGRRLVIVILLIALSMIVAIYITALAIEPRRGGDPPVVAIISADLEENTTMRLTFAVSSSVPLNDLGACLRVNTSVYGPTAHLSGSSNLSISYGYDEPLSLEVQDDNGDGRLGSGESILLKGTGVFPPGEYNFALIYLPSTNTMLCVGNFDVW